MLLAGKAALITGAAGGLGAGIATAFAQEGARLAILDIDGERLGSEAGRLQELDCEVLPLVVDLRDEEGCARAVDEALSRFGGLDVLVNNAGLLHVEPIEKTTRQQWDDMIAVNMRAPYYLCQRIGAAMAERGGGSIVNITSVAGRTAANDCAIYGMTKAGLAALTRQIAVEWGPRGIRCNSVFLGGMSWIMKRTPPALPDVDGLPLRRLGGVDEYASAVVFLASDRASYVNGAELPVDGARSLTLLTNGAPWPPS